MEFRSDCATTGSGWVASYTSSSTAAACPAPASLAETNITPMSAMLTWSSVAGASQYEISIKRDVETSWTNYSSTSNSFEVTGLAANAYYEWKVRSDCGASGTSGYAGSVLETPNVGTDNTTPGAYSVTACNGTLTDSGGTLGGYMNFEEWTYTIAPTGATAVSLTFSFMDLESGYDYLYVYDGVNTSAPLLGTYTGTTLPPAVTSSGAALTVRFSSDSWTMAPGFEASWTCTAVPLCEPTTSVGPLDTWYTADSTIDFTDDDVCATGGFQYRFYNVQSYTGSEWRSNAEAGFFYDDFDLSTIHPDWTSAVGSWAINSGAVRQSDEAAGNTKLYADLSQDNASTYLYHWQGSIGGTGTNRRAGIHFFADDPSLSNLGNSYFVYFRVDQNKAQIYDVNSDSWSLETDDDVTLDPNVLYDFKVSFNPISGQINCYVDDILVSSWTDPSPHTSGDHVSLRTGNCDAYYHDFHVYQSRASTSQLVSIGSQATDDATEQSSNPTQDAMRINSLVIDNAGAWSDAAQDQAKVDWTPPSTVSVNDGTGADVDIITTSGQLSANWTTATDAHSDVVAYWYSIGTSPGATDVLGWTNNGLSTNMTESGLPLSGSSDYYVCVQVENGAGLMSASMCSDGVSSCTPSTTVGALSSTWYTADFTATFSDVDCGGSTHFYQVQDHDGTEWRANGQRGFLYDAFDALHPDWTTETGSWSISSASLYQSDATDGNTNIHAEVLQDAAHTYLYEFDAKWSGAGSSRRAGFHFFCDDPTLPNRGNSYFVWFRLDDAKLQFYKVDNDVYSLEKDVVVSVADNVWHNYKITYDPSTGDMSVYEDDAFLDNWVDASPYTSGSAVSFRTGNAEMWVDEVRVYQSRNASSELVTLSPTGDGRYESATPTSDAVKVVSTIATNVGAWGNMDEQSAKVDLSPPSTVSVSDGTSTDIATTTSTSSLSANWTAAIDAHSGVTNYYYAIGTTPGDDDLVAWTSNGTATSVTATGLSLSIGQTYYISVYSENGAGLQSAIVSTDGQLVISSAPYQVVEFEFFLEGDFDAATGLMRTDLNDAGLVDLSQPYDTAPWNYSGSESVGSLPTNVVDWVLIEARAESDTSLVESRAALLTNTGEVVDIDGDTGVKFYDVVYGSDYFFVVRHRNHLAVLSSGTTSIPASSPIDMSDPANVMGGQLVSVGSGEHALYTGDMDANGLITVQDLNLYLIQSSQVSTYTEGDCNMDGNVTVADFNLYLPNGSLIGHEVVRY